MYAYKNDNEDRLFIERTALIKRTKPVEMMAYLGIKEKFMLGEIHSQASNHTTTRASNLNYTK